MFKDKTCPTCKKSFSPQTARHTYCSDVCKLGEEECKMCGGSFIPTRKSRRLFCSTNCAYEFKAPVGSKFVDQSNGYVYVKVPKGTVGTKIRDGKPSQWMFEHRFVMQQNLGRPLGESENVHHIDGNRSNNSISNLELWNQAQPTGIRAGQYHCPGCNCGR